MRLSNKTKETNEGEPHGKQEAFLLGLEQHFLRSGVEERKRRLPTGVTQNIS
jgi:hypothetical protein